MRQRPVASQHQRDHQPELRLVGEQSEQNAGKDRPRIEGDEREAHERGGEEAVVAMPEVHEHGGIGEREEEPQPVMPGLVPGIHVLLVVTCRSRGWPGIRAFTPVFAGYARP